jgi:hypothetical protein
MIGDFLITPKRRMSEKDATNHMLCWTPGTDQVAVIPRPDFSRLSSAYRCSTLACWNGAQEASLERRIKWVFIEATHLIVHDKCDPAAVHKALSELDEYRRGFNTEIWGFVRGV